MTAGRSQGGGSSTVFAAAALAMLLFAVAFFNGRPAFFADTPYYYSQGQALAEAVGVVPAKALTSAQRRDPLSVEPGSAGAATGALTVAAARSPIYGLLLFGCERLGGLWLLVGVQCLAAGWTIAVAIRCVAKERGRQAFFCAAPILALASSLPFFAAFTMPDIFAGLDILAAALLLLYAGALRRGEPMMLFWLLTLGAASHASNLITLAAMIPAAAIARAWPRTSAAVAPKGAATLAAACGLAVALVVAAGALYTLHTGRLQASPPFLMARVLEDGPGRTYLARHCPDGAAPDLCRFRRQPLDDAEDFLWSGVSGRGVFMKVDLAGRRRLKAAEPAFVLQAVIEEPLVELRAALRNWGEQITLYATVEPVHNPAEFLQYAWWRNTSVWMVLPGHQECEHRPSLCRPRIPRAVMDLTQSLSIGLSLTLLAVVLVSSDLRAAMRDKGLLVQDRLRQPLIFTGFIVTAILLNAAVCGIISGPFPRYQARLIWLLPLSAVLLAWTLPWRAAARRMLVRTSAGDQRPSAARPAP